jgi:hypothetical protein
MSDQIIIEKELGLEETIVFKYINNLAKVI